jgi:LCP family protein required for cell wall assembly
MKTTLKRGMGRAAAVNGDVRAVYPPGVRTPMRRYRQPEPARRTALQLVGRGLLWTFAALLIVGVGAAGGAYLYYHQSAAALAPHSLAVKRATRELAVPSATEPALALIVGYDKRAGTEADVNGSRSDTLMLVRADPRNHTISMLSFPRDLTVEIHCPGRATFVDRINAAYATCGIQGTLETIKALTGLPINYLITVNFHGFKLLVNRLGGVWIDVDHRYYNPHGTGYAAIDLEPGYQKLDGQQALDFVRFRHTDSDLYRVARQQMFVQALKERIAGNFSLFGLTNIVGAIKDNHNVEIGQGGGGTVPFDTALSYARFAYGLPSGHFFRVTIGDLTGFNTLQAPQSAIDDAVAKLVSPDVAAAAKAQAAALGIKAKPKPAALKPSQISALVLNGTSIAGFARDTSYKLALRGYHPVQLSGQMLANAPSSNYDATRIYWDPDVPKAEAAAGVLKTLFSKATVEPLTPEITPFARDGGSPQVVVVLGNSFDGTFVSPNAPSDTTPKHAPPQVVSDPGMTLAQLRDARPRVPFPLRVPHVIAGHSQLAQLDPVRVYKPAPHQKAVRLTFVTGAFGNEYWGIQETDWNEAPVLHHPSETRTLGGRRYDFYYSGSHLHMVVLRSGNSSYWVVNTLLDSLSNETMIAVARGLQPLGR